MGCLPPSFLIRIFLESLRRNDRLDRDALNNRHQRFPRWWSQCSRRARQGQLRVAVHPATINPLAIITYGALIVRDSLVKEEDNSTFLDLIEVYFAQPVENLKAGKHLELCYQVGATLENTERPKCAVDEPCLKVFARLDPEEWPLDISGHPLDPKGRLFWRMAE